MRRKVRVDHRSIREEWRSKDSKRRKGKKKKSKKPVKEVIRYCADCKLKQTISMQEVYSSFKTKCTACGGTLITKKDIG